MRNSIFAFASAAMFLAAGAAGAAEDARPNQYSALVTAKAPGIASVKFVLKSQGGRGREMNRDTSGTIVDASGLVMISRTALGGGREFTFGGGRVRQGGGQFTPSGFKVVFPGDEKEYEAILGASDSTLNLAFVRVKDLAGKKLDVASFDAAPAVKIGQEVVAVMRHGKGFDFAPYFERGLVAGEVKQPRAMWIVSGDPGAPGLPLFDLQGGTLGVLSHQQGADGEGGGTFLIPASAIKATVALAVKQSEEALKKEAEKAKETEEEKKEGEEGEGEGESEGDGGGGN